MLENVEIDQFIGTIKEPLMLFDSFISIHQNNESYSLSNLKFSNLNLAG